MQEGHLPARSEKIASVTVVLDKLRLLRCCGEETAIVSTPWSVTPVPSNTTVTKFDNSVHMGKTEKVMMDYK